MKTFINISIPVILTISLVLLLNTGSSSIYGQIIGQTNQTNQTSGQNTTQQAQQQLEQANQQLAQAKNKKYLIKHIYSNNLHKPTKLVDKTQHNKLNNN